MKLTRLILLTIAGVSLVLLPRRSSKKQDLTQNPSNFQKSDSDKDNKNQ